MLTALSLTLDFGGPGPTDGRRVGQDGRFLPSECFPCLGASKQVATSSKRVTHELFWPGKPVRVAQHSP